MEMEKFQMRKFSIFNYLLLMSIVDEYAVIAWKRIAQ